MSIKEQTEGAVSVDVGFRASLEAEDDGRSRVVERAERAHARESLSRYGSERWEMPGFGEKGPRCGEFYPDGVCEAGHVEWGNHQCGRRSCPHCWAVWARDGSVRAATRIQSFRYTQPPDHRRQVAHAVVSPAAGDVRTEREYWNGCSKAAEIAEAKGFRGFSVIPHPWRLTELGEELFEHVDPEHGKWVWIRWLLQRSDHWECLFEWSPHYHIVGMTTPDMEEGKESDEWAYHFIRSLKAFEGTHDSESHKEVYGLYRYLLSHTGYPEGSSKQVVRWYGDLANSVFVEDATEDWQHEKPPEGVRETIQSEIEEVAGHVVDDEDGEGGGEDEEAECEHEGCSEQVISVWDIRQYLRQVDVQREVAEVMEVAWEWRMGEIRPPPGLVGPMTRDGAEEAFGVLLNGP